MKKMKTKEVYMDFSKLPQKYGRIQWRMLNEDIIPFKYKDVEGELIVSFDRVKKRNHNIIKVCYNGNCTFVHHGSLAKGSIGNIVGRYNSGYIYNVGDKVSDSVIVEKQIRIGMYKGYVLRCLIYNETFKRKEDKLKYQKNSPYVTGNKVCKGNSLYNKKEVLPYLKNVDDAKKYTPHSGKRIDCVCPNCGYERDMSITELVYNGFICHMCAPSLSYPERFMIALLNINDIEYLTQVKVGETNKRFDFYLPKHNTVIETHGIQHYKEDKNSFFDYSITTQSDDFKRKYCQENNIQFIEIDCRNSDINFILPNAKKMLNNIITNFDKNNIEEELSTLTDMKFIKRMISEYHDGKTFSYLSKKYNLPESKIRSLLKNLGEFKRRSFSKKTREVVNTTELFYFDTMVKASDYVNPKRRLNIMKVIRGTYQYSGISPLNGKKLKWMYYEDYIKEYGYTGLSCPLINHE